MKVSSRVTLRSIDDLAIAGTLVGLPVKGRDTRTKEEKEWYVLLNFLRQAIPAGILQLPFDVRCGDANANSQEPDFVASNVGTDDVVALFEITEATNEADQREMTLFQRSTKTAALLGEFGGRFSNGASHPEIDWASDIVDAVKRKSGKTIFRPSPLRRHLLVYPNSNASMLMSDEDDERQGVELLQEQFARDGAFRAIANGCSIDVLGKHIVCFDALADQAVIVAIKKQDWLDWKPAHI